MKLNKLSNLVPILVVYEYALRFWEALVLLGKHQRIHPPIVVMEVMAGDVAGIAGCLDHSNLIQRVKGSNPPSDLSQSARRESTSSL